MKYKLEMAEHTSPLHNVLLPSDGSYYNFEMNGKLPSISTYQRNLG